MEKQIIPAAQIRAYCMKIDEFRKFQNSLATYLPNLSYFTEINQLKTMNIMGIWSFSKCWWAGLSASRQTQWDLSDDLS